MSKHTSWRHLLWAAPLTVVAGAPAAAQQSTIRAEMDFVDEVVVTARRREENLQDVPLAVTVVTADQIRVGGIKSIEDAIQLDPSLNFDTGFAPYDTRIVIRGLSPTRGRPNVATLVDGIDISSEAVGVAGGSLLINPKLLDIERIEVVKGPQSALYGRSAFAGAVQYITKDPTDEFTGRVAAEFGSFSHQEYTANLSGPLFSDKLGYTITALKYEQDGFYDNTITGNELGASEGAGVAASLKFEPTDNLDFKLRYEYSHDKFGQPAQAYVQPNGANAAPASASSCVGGPINDPSCTTLPYYQAINPMQAGAGYTIQQNGVNTARVLETALGNNGTFNDMVIPSYRGAIGEADGMVATLSPNYIRNPNGTEDYAGSDRNVNRVSLIANWAVGPGTFSSLSGYTDADVYAETDLDHYAEAGNALGNDVSSIQQSLITQGDTYQFSQELRFTSDFDGPVQVITGLQYWQEKVSQVERNFTAIAAGTRCQLIDPPGPAVGELAQGLCGGLPPGFGINAPNARQSTTVGQFIDDVWNAGSETVTERETDHRSIYLQLGWQINDAFALSVEGRYVDEENTVTGPDPVESAAMGDAAAAGPGSVTLCGSNGPCAVTGLPPIFAGMGFIGRGLPNSPRGFGPVRPIEYRSFTRDDQYFTPRVSLDWRVNDDALLYLSYGQGQKPGGFSTITIGSVGLSTREDIEFEPEKIAQYELGWKTSWLDRRLLLNGALFYMDFTDKQVSTQAIINNQLTNVIQNAAGAEVKGLELALQYKPIPEVTLAAAYTYLDGTYTDYRVQSTGAPEIARVGNCEVEVIETQNATSQLYEFRPVCMVDRTGNKLEDTPEQAFTVQAGYRGQLAEDRSWFIDVAARWQDRRYLEDDNSIWLDSYVLTDARFGIEGRRWSAIAFVDNLFDDNTVKTAGTGPAIALSNFRFGQVVAPGQTAVVGGRASGLIPSPIIPTLVFASLPDPRTYRVQIAYKF